MTLQTVFQLVGLLFLLNWLFTTFKEGLQATEPPMIIVDNAFTDTKCVSDNLPLLRFHPRENPNTFRCLSVDGQNCINRNSLAIPSTIPCKDVTKYCDMSKASASDAWCTQEVNGQNVSIKGVNNWLSKDAVRNAKANPSVPVSKAFQDYENLRSLAPNDPALNKNVKLLTCTPDGLSNPNHWCGQVWNTINSECNTPRGQHGEYKTLCDTAQGVPSFINSSRVGRDVDTIDYLQIAAAQARAVQDTQIARNRLLQKLPPPPPPTPRVIRTTRR